MNELASRDELQRDIYRLADESLHGELTDASQDELQRLLAEHPDARQFYLAAIADAANLRRWSSGTNQPSAELAGPPAGLDADLLQALCAESTAPTGNEALHSPTAAIVPPVSVYRWRAHPIHFTAAVLLLTVTAWFFLFQLVQQPQPVDREERAVVAPLVARITALEGCQWVNTADAPPLFNGAHLRRDQTLELATGLAEITFRSGAVVLLEGPTRFVVAAEHTGRLTRGRLTAQVPEAARGFVITAAGATVVDLGTEFGVEVAAGGRAEAHVFTGRVTVALAAHDGSLQAFDLAESEGLRWRGPHDQPQRIAARGEQFVRVARRDIQLLNPSALVSTDYHVPHVSGQQVGDRSREWAFAAVTNKVTSHHFDHRDGYDTVGVGPNAQARTDFAGLLYERPSRFDRIIVHMGGQAHDGGSWREPPSVFVLTEPVDTNQMPPEGDPAHWRRIEARLILGPPQFDAAVEPDPGAVLVFDLTDVPVDQRTGYGWAVGGVDGDGIGFILITELAAFGAPLEDAPQGDAPHQAAETLAE